MLKIGHEVIRPGKAREDAPVTIPIPEELEGVPGIPLNLREVDWYAREYPLETRCCITGEKVKQSFCRYPDPDQGTMMVMSRETMLKYSREGQSLSSTFDQIKRMRRKLESKA